MSNINWFKLNRSLHRDIGYFCIGMTLVFAISGIALNHIHQWNSNYQITTTVLPINLSVEQLKQPTANRMVFEQLNLSTLKAKTQYWQNPTQYKIFLDNATIVVDTKQQSATLEQVTPRPIFRSLNFLHLNEARKAWTWFSDIYAILLVYLALSALFMVKGKKGVLSPRGLLVIIGFALPIGFVVLYAS